ncbi:hypothetical protein UFOVP1439_4 [uncultured Caudovirales phage]|uniref:Uncharacterized protein n=1 Tax=uncultured Caudovirales phage TaxID=2100421 RepID=A0A6J5SER0_9CAUD|nr:hypothetical protein UFOVP1085_41 [uncultured Caudovirales phage]CAB4212294.1 hypothetical protein UFOVP1439_4 [uncultured Caudovirales phage]
MSLYYQNDFLTTLAYLMGERSVNTTTTTTRADFIQSTLEEAYKAYPWRFAKSNATLTLVSGIATMPTDYDNNHQAFAKFNQGTTSIDLDMVDADDEDDLEDGDRAVWVEAIGNGDRFILKTKDSDVSTIRLRYQEVAPILSTASMGTPYFNKRTIALGARRDVKLGQNPDADISQDQAIFERELAKDIAAQQVNAPRKRRRTAHGQTGRATGDF